MSDWNDWNQAVIDEFRANGGRVGGMFKDKPLLLVYNTGAKTGIKRITPLLYQQIPGGYAVFASKGGADTNPDWYYNLTANPETQVEVGNRTIPVSARIAMGEERDRIWARQKKDWPQFEDYESKTTRVIPVIVLERV